MYDMHQWTLRPELLGSMSIYIVLLATMEFTPLCRVGALVMMAVWSFFNWDPTFSTTSFFLGALLADLYLVLEANDASRLANKIGYRDWRLQILNSRWPFLLTLISLMFASYAMYRPERSAWSNFMYHASISLFPLCKVPRCKTLSFS